MELIRGPPRNRASKSLILSMAVVMATASEVVMTLLTVVATNAAAEDESAVIGRDETKDNEFDGEKYSEARGDAQQNVTRLCGRMASKAE